VHTYALGSEYVSVSDDQRGAGYVAAISGEVCLFKSQARVWQAQQNLKPVRCAASSGKCDINVNRRFRTPEGTRAVGRNWEGVVDQTLRVIRFDDYDETPVATIVHYACHPTTMAWDTELFTPDYPGAARQVVEQQIGGTLSFPSRCGG